MRCATCRHRCSTHGWGFEECSECECKEFGSPESRVEIGRRAHLRKIGKEGRLAICSAVYFQRRIPFLKTTPWGQKEPMILYHHSPSRNRASILRDGLQTSYDQSIDRTDPYVTGGIYLTTKSDFSTASDVWAANVDGLPIEEDWTTQLTEDADETWFVVYQDIPPGRLQLLTVANHA